MRTGSGGYTLTELLVVLAIMGLMVALAPPLLKTARIGVQEKTSVFRLAAQLEAARDRAIDTQEIVRVPLSSGQSVVFYPDGSATGITIHENALSLSVSPISGRVTVSG